MARFLPLEVTDVRKDTRDAVVVTLRPRPEDELDKDAVFPKLSDEARAWWERAILSIHPHSTWSIHVRTPLTPAKASWNRPRR